MNTKAQIEFVTSLSLFDPIRNSDPSERAKALRELDEKLRADMAEYKTTGFCLYIPTLYRLTQTTPHTDVRETLLAILSDFGTNHSAQKGSKIKRLRGTDNSSAYIPSKEVTNPRAEDLRRDMEDVYLLHGRISHLDLIFGYHPLFLQSFTQSMNLIMMDDGPLPLTWRFYLSILAATRYRCEYLVALQEFSFLKNGGDITWLEGIHAVPQKLRSILEVNALLAHQPWLLTKRHIKRLTSNKGPDSWSISEMVHAIVIMCTFHSLSGVAYGLGLTAEPDMVALTYAEQPAQKSAADEQPATIERNSSKPQAEELMKLMKSNVTTLINEQRIKDKSDPFESVKTAYFDPNKRSRRSIRVTRSDSKQRIASCEEAFYTGFTSLPLESPQHRYMARPEPHEQGEDAKQAEDTGVISATEEKLDEVNFLTYEPFDMEEFDIFYLHEYSWKEHGYPLLNRFLKNMGPQLDMEMDTIKDLTYNTYNDAKDVDTSPYRQAIWYYVLRLYGLHHDDYDYEKLHIFLNHPTKVFVEKVACDPETMTIADFNALEDYSLTYSERTHICLLATEAHRQASLLYGLHAVMKYMTSAM